MTGESSSKDANLIISPISKNGVILASPKWPPAIVSLTGIIIILLHFSERVIKLNEIKHHLEILSVKKKDTVSIFLINSM